MFPIFPVIGASFLTSSSILMLAYMCNTKIDFELGFGFIMSSTLALVFWAISLEGLLS